MPSPDPALTLPEISPRFTQTLLGVGYVWSDLALSWSRRGLYGRVVDEVGEGCAFVSGAGRYGRAAARCPVGLGGVAAFAFGLVERSVLGELGCLLGHLGRFRANHLIPATGLSRIMVFSGGS